MIPISVVIVTKDEERDIGDALESVKDFEDIVIVDSFSEDRTVEICKKYTNRIYQQEWRGYARQKQLAVNYAEKPWVLILDADERVTPELKEEIKHLFANPSRTNSNGYLGFYIPRKNFFLGRWIKYGGWWPDYTIRLFRKDSGYVEEREVHEKIIVKGSVGYLKNPLEHHTYRSISEYIKKMEAYSTLAAKEFVSKNPEPSQPSLIFKMSLNPIFTFLKMLFLKQGFRDGIHGFILAVLYSFYTFLKYLKAWEMRR